MVLAVVGVVVSAVEEVPFALAVLIATFVCQAWISRVAGKGPKAIECLD